MGAKLVKYLNKQIGKDLFFSFFCNKNPQVKQKPLNITHAFELAKPHPINQDVSLAYVLKPFLPSIFQF